MATTTTAVGSDGVSFDLVAPAPPARPRTLLFATALVAAACAMAIFAVVAIYIEARHGVRAGRQTWLPAGAIPLIGPNMALFTLLLSLLSVRWAHDAIAHDDRQNTWVAIGITLLLGVGFINADSFIWGGLHLGVHKSEAALLILIAGGMHLAMVIGALVFLLLTAFRTLGGQFSSSNREGVVAAALFWYVTVAVYCVLWYAIYVTK